MTVEAYNDTLDRNMSTGELEESDANTRTGFTIRNAAGRDR